MAASRNIVKLAPTDLNSHLAGTLSPLYLVSGDEPLQTSDAQGFSEREIFFVERSADVWSDILLATESLSLFASRRMIEIRMPGGKPGKGAGDLLRVIAAAGPDLLILILTGRIEREALQSDWVRAAEQKGVSLSYWPVDLPRLPAWLHARFRAVGLEADAAAIELLVDRTEGNLLAANQEIQKLALLAGGNKRVNVAMVAASAGDSSRFDVLQLCRAVTAGDAARAMRLLDGLRAENTGAPLVLWGLLQARAELLRDAGSASARRLPFARLAVRAARADRMAKGQMYGDAWGEMSLLTAELCGRRVLPLSRWQMRMQANS
jgi:DNA polymerase-3 subunit delta